MKIDSNLGAPSSNQVIGSIWLFPDQHLNRRRLTNQAVTKNGP
jgi:hypothetical protein